MANWWWLILLAVVLMVAGVWLLRRRRAMRPRAAASFGVEAGAAPAVSVQLRVMRVLAEWAGVAVADVPPDSKKIADLWRQKLSNPQLADGHLSALISRLTSELPTAQLNLAPPDLRDGGGLATIDLLIRHVERRA